MGRLIDVDELEKRLQDFKEWEDCDGNPLHTMSERQRISKCIEISREQPTAYNTDRVVEELEHLVVYEVLDGLMTGEWIKKEQVLKIVKAGGIE